MPAETGIEIELLTAEQLAMLVGVESCELVEGRVVAMPPTGGEHARYESRLNRRLAEFVEAGQLGEVLVGEVGIITRRDPDTVRGADIAFVSRERLAPSVLEGFLRIAPDLVVEIVSPHDAWADVMEKLGEYFSAGVRLVWIVTPRTRAVYVYRSLTDMRLLSQDETLDGGDVLPGFALPVAEIFA